MNSTLVFYGAHFIAQMVFLVLCMHVAGKFLQVNFGRPLPTVLKAALLASVVLTMLLVLHPHLPVCRRWAIGGLVAVAYWLGLRIAFGLDDYEVFPLTPIFVVGSLLVWIVVNVALAKPVLL